MNITTRYILTIFTAIFAISCTSNKKAELKEISVTIEPQKYFLEQIVGDKYSINCITPSGSNPESFDATPSQMMALGNSALYFKVGYLPIEDILIERTASNNPDLKIVNCSEGIEVIGEPHIHHDHEHGLGDAEDHEHGEGCNHGHAAGDPHIWSSVTTARIMAKNMYNTILLTDSANAEFYTESFNKLNDEFSKTDSIIRSYIDKAPSKSFVIYHPALSYYSQDYGLNQLSIESEGKSPSPVRLKELIDQAKAENVKVVFIQQEFDTKNAETIAKEIGATIVPINLLAYDWHSEMIKIAKALALETNE